MDKLNILSVEAGSQALQKAQQSSSQPTSADYSADSPLRILFKLKLPKPALLSCFPLQ